MTAHGIQYTVHSAQNLPAGQAGTEHRRRRKIARFIGCVLLCIALVTLSSSSPALASEDLIETLGSYLRANYPWEQIEVSNIEVIGKAGEESPEGIIVEKGPLGKAAFSFIYKNGERAIVKADVRALGRIVKSKRAFRKGHVIHEQDIYVVMMDIRKMPGNTVREPEKILGRSLKRSISANIPVVEGMVEMSQVIERGRRVVLLIDHNGLTITAQGKTREKGHVGMPIKVINFSSNKEVSGILIDENTVKVEI